MLVVNVYVLSVCVHANTGVLSVCAHTTIHTHKTPGLSGFAAADLPVSAAPFIPTAAAPHGAGLVAGHAHMLAPPPTTTGAAVASLTHPSGSAAAAAGGGAVETFRMDITREQANMLLSAAGQQLIQYVQQVRGDDWWCTTPHTA